jgi:hypothetical protein
VLSLRRVSTNEKQNIKSRNPEADASKPTANDVIRLKLMGANSNPKITGLDELPGKSNYFIGNDPDKWRTGVSNYAKVKLEDVYRGIDLVYYGNQRKLEYDWIVNPGADLKTIKFAVEGKTDLKINAQGDLILDKEGELRLDKPLIYQQHSGSRTEIAGRYLLLGKREVGFRLDSYDVSLPLVIDPILTYSTYLGGSGEDSGECIAFDSSGNAYVTGHTYSDNFPMANPFQPTNNGADSYAFVTKLNTSGSALVYSTYLGGSDWGSGHGIFVDFSGNAYVTGRTGSANFPTVNAFQTSYGGGDNDAFVAKLNPSGSALVYSTYLGGSGYDSGTGISVDSSGNAYVTGSTDSTNFPTANPFQASFGGNFDVYVTKLNPSGSALVYSSYLGGSGADYGRAIAVDSLGNAYVTGSVTSANFPTANPFQASISGTRDAFITKISFAKTFGDVDSDARSDLTVWRPSSGVWYSLLSKSPGSYTSTKWGTSGDKVVPEDYDGDGKMDVAVWRPSNGVWYIRPSGATGYAATSWGTNGDAPVSGDYDRDGKVDIAVWRLSNGTWYVRPSGSPGTYTATNWGVNTDIPVPGDYDGDGNADVAIFRPGTGVWYIRKSSVTGSYTSTAWGTSSDIPVPGDYDADGKTDIAVWRSATGVWYIRPSSTTGYTATSWGTNGDTPVSGDYDGDGKADVTVWRSSNGTWYIKPSGTPGSYTARKWGIAGDMPISSLTGILNSAP